MGIVKAETAMTQVKPGVSRRLIHGNDLMMVVIDFDSGPWSEPEPPHSHIHEQTTYVVSGELILFCEDEPERHLREGDMFFIPSNKKHTIQLLTRRLRLVDCFNPLRTEFLSGKTQ